MKQRIITGLVLGAIAIFGIMLGIESFRILLLLLVIVSCVEIYQLKENKYTILVPFLMFASIYLISISDSIEQIAVLSSLLLVLGLIHLIDEKFELIDYFMTFSFVYLMGMTINGAIELYSAAGPVSILWLFIANYSTDTGAYFVGRQFGRRKLNERLSPKKTIEGSIGGWIVGFVASMIFGLLFLDNHLTNNFLLVFSIMIPLVAQMGDLIFSSIKRVYHVKDFGQLFPGHGGVLDRIDSLILSLFTVNLLLVIWSLL